MEYIRRYSYKSLLKKVQSKVLPRDSCMFKPKRSKLLKRIWKYPKLSASMTRSECLEIKFQLHSLLKTLSDEDLDVLLKGLQSSGGVETECICLRTTDTRNFRQRFQCDPNYIFAKTFRFPRTTSDDVVKSLFCCSHNKDYSSDSICLNPFHSSIVVDTESPPPPYSEETLSLSQIRTPLHDELMSKTDLSSIQNFTKSVSVSSEDSIDDPHSSIWCRVTYWEQKQRVGKIFDVRDECVNVFENLPQGDGLCLGLLEYGDVEHTEISDKVKGTIGHGFQLSRESDGIWLYNRSSIVLFAGSPTIQLEGMEILHPVVKRLPVGSSILVCDIKLLEEASQRLQLINMGGDTSCETGTMSAKRQPFCIRVSFGKGWGANYRRLSVTQCPCWVEIYLSAV